MANVVFGTLGRRLSIACPVHAGANALIGTLGTDLPEANVLVRTLGRHLPEANVLLRTLRRRLSIACPAHSGANGLLRTCGTHWSVNCCRPFDHSRAHCHRFTESVGSQAKQKPLLEFKLVKTAATPPVFFSIFCGRKGSHITLKMGKLRNKLFINLIKRFVYF